MSQTIMIGVNDPNIAYLLQRYAEESGHASTQVCQSQEIPALALTLKPTLIILDVALVETTNWEIVRRLKAEPATSTIPVIIYSYLDEPPEKWHEGVDGYLKSARYDDFVAVLEHTKPLVDDTRSDPEQIALQEAITSEDTIEHHPPEPSDHSTSDEEERVG